MKSKDVKKLDNGLYKLYWKSGGFSLASVGRLHDGTPWFAPTNWTNESPKFITSVQWDIVDHAELIVSETHQ